MEAIYRFRRRIFSIFFFRKVYVGKFFQKILTGIKFEFLLKYTGKQVYCLNLVDLYIVYH